MSYDNWKCTDPNDRYLGHMGIVEAYELFHDGEISLGDLGEILLDNGCDPREVRQMLTEEIRYPIPVGYFGKE